MEIRNYLKDLYGDDVAELTKKEILALAGNSNIPFDKEYVELGMSFMVLNAKDIFEGKKVSCSLRLLVSESFGYAAIYINTMLMEAYCKMTNLEKAQQKLIEVLKEHNVSISTETVAAGTTIVLMDLDTGKRRPWGGV